MTAPQPLDESRLDEVARRARLVMAGKNIDLETYRLASADVPDLLTELTALRMGVARDDQVATLKLLLDIAQGQVHRQELVIEQLVKELHTARHTASFDSCKACKGRLVMIRRQVEGTL